MPLREGDSQGPSYAVASLSMYLTTLGRAPIKGCRRERVREVTVDAAGLAGDRSLAFVADGMALRTMANPELLALRVSVMGCEVRLTLPTGESATQSIGPGERALIDYWGRPLPMALQPGPVSDLASEHLGRRVLLGSIRPPRRAIYANPVSVGLTSRFAELGCEKDAERFRCNLVVDDSDDPVGEAAWVGRSIRIGDVVLSFAKRLERCVVIDRDPITGERDRRLFAELGASGDPWVALGADVTNPGVLRVGQPVEWL